MARITLYSGLASTLLALAACGGGADPVAAGTRDADAQPLGLARGHLALPDFGANAVADWSRIGAATITLPPAAAGTPEERRPNYAFDMATLHVALYDAAVALTRSHAPFYAPVPEEPGLSALPVEPALHAAAHGVLLGLFPNRSAQYQGAYDAALGALPADAATARALDIGRDVARRVLAARADDGRWTPVPPYVPGSAPGDFRGSNPVNLTAPFVRPFAMRTASQFRADPPPALDSAGYAAEVAEVQAWGAAASTLRSAAQTEAARFHTEPPPLFWTRNLRRFASSQPTLVGNARLMAMLWVAHADATIGCFESKYHFNRWRPTSAIRLADTDGNPATVADPAWTPLLPTPNHPEYPAAHSCAASAMAETVRQVFGTPQVAFSFDSSVTGQAQGYASVNAFTREIGDARVHGGMHFRSATVQGEVLGMKAAKFAARERFEPVR